MRVRARGGWEEWREMEDEARLIVGEGGGGGGWGLKPAWNWFKWSVIIVTELGAFLVSLKEVLESTPRGGRRYQRLV